MRLVAASVLVAILAPCVAAPAAAAERPTITVLPFELSPSSPLSTALADMLLNDVAAATSLQVVAREQAAGAAYVVTGAIRSVTPELRIDVRLFRSADGRIVRAASVAGRKDRFFVLQTALVGKVVDVLGDLLAAGDADRIKQSVRANHVDRFAAALEYGKGLEARDAANLEAAAQSLQKVVASEPAFTLGKSRCNDVVGALYHSGGRVPPPPPAPRRTSRR